MKKAILLLINALLLSVSDTSNAQNLVPNPGFENHIGCPVETGELYRCQDWSSYGFSPDYFHLCAPDTVAGVPTNSFGYQFAATGDAYAGFINESGGPAPPKEYLGAALAQPLTIGQKYYASFKVSFCGFGCLSSNMGIRMSTVAYDSTSIQVSNNYATVYTASVINDSLNWYQVQGSFIADSSYAYIIIGNFFNTGNCIATTYISYYFLDDICLSTDSTICYTSTGIVEPGNDIVINLFPNPFNDELNIQGNTNEKMEITLYDVASRKILEKQFVENLTVNTKHFESGVYLYEIKNDRGVVKTGKVIKD